MSGAYRRSGAITSTTKEAVWRRAGWSCSCGRGSTYATSTRERRSRMLRHQRVCDGVVTAYLYPKRSVRK